MTRTASEFSFRPAKSCGGSATQGHPRGMYRSSAKSRNSPVAKVSVFRASGVAEPTGSRKEHKLCIQALLTYSHVFATRTQALPDDKPGSTSKRVTQWHIRSSQHPHMERFFQSFPKCNVKFFERNAKNRTSFARNNKSTSFSNFLVARQSSRNFRQKRCQTELQKATRNVTRETAT